MTTEAFDSTAPYFDPEGKYLYFLSTRDYNEVLGVFDIEFSNPKAGRVYIATLRADEPSPFPALSDEVAVQSPDVLLAPPGTSTPRPEASGAANEKAENSSRRNQRPERLSQNLPPKLKKLKKKKSLARGRR